MKGMERATIRDVAKAAGVSITTVSMVLNNYPGISDETKKRVEEIALSMNYVPNSAGRSLGGITEPVIGLLINNLMPEEPSGAVYGFLSGMCYACRDNNIGFLLITTDKKDQKKNNLKRVCLSKGLSGLVCCGFRLNDPFIQEIAEGKVDIPCACIDIQVDNPMVDNISIDNVRAADEAVSFLTGIGRKNIALVNSSDTVDVSLRRTAGYKAALERAGLPILPERIVNGEFEEITAYEKVKRLLKKDKKIDAVFCISDLMALGACRAAEEAGLKIGKDIMVVGFDDIPAAKYLYGGLTTVRQDFFRMGYAAGCNVYGKLKGAPPEDAEKLYYELVVRGSARQPAPVE